MQTAIPFVLWSVLVQKRNIGDILQIAMAFKII